MRRRRRNPKRSSFLKGKIGKIVLAILAGAAVFFIYKKVRAAQLAQQNGTAPVPASSGGGFSPPAPQQLPAGGGGMAEVFPGSSASGTASVVMGEDFSNG